MPLEIGKFYTKKSEVEDPNEENAIDLLLRNKRFYKLLKENRDLYGARSSHYFFRSEIIFVTDFYLFEEEIQTYFILFDDKILMFATTEHEINNHWEEII